MKIVSWNCAGAFRKKFDSIKAYGADVYVIQECENPETTNDVEYRTWAKNFLWIGDNKNRGLGIFAKANVELRNNFWDSTDMRYFISVNVNKSFNLIAVWSHRSVSSSLHYIGQFWGYLQINKDLIRNCIAIGDFNSNKIWDKRGRCWNHTEVVKELEGLGIRSLYHDFFEENQGEESKATFFLQRNTNKPYHIDFAFADRACFDTIKRVDIGATSEWLRLSDHMPLVIEL